MSEWKCIEAAPKDRDILLCTESERFVGSWRDNPYGNGISGWGRHTDCTTLWAHGVLFWADIPDLPKIDSDQVNNPKLARETK